MTPTLEERQRLILENVGLAHYVVDQTMSSVPMVALAMDREDLVQEALIQLVECVDHADPEKPRAFSTYACQRMKFHMKDLSRRSVGRPSQAQHREAVSRRNSMESLDALVELEERVIQPSITDTQDIADVDLADLLTILSHDEREVIQWCIVEGQDQGKIAPILHLSSSRISQIKTQAFAKLREHIHSEAQAA